MNVLSLANGRIMAINIVCKVVLFYGPWPPSLHLYYQHREKMSFGGSTTILMISQNITLWPYNFLFFCSMGNTEYNILCPNIFDVLVLVLSHIDGTRRPHSARGAVTANAFFQQHNRYVAKLVRG